MSFHGSIAPFLALNSIPLSGWTKFICSSIEGILSCFQVLTIMNKQLYTSASRFLCGHKFSPPLGKCQGAQLLDHTVRICVVLNRLFKRAILGFAAAVGDGV